MPEKPLEPRSLTAEHLGYALEQLERMQALRELQQDEGQPKQQLNLRLPVSSLHALEKIAEHYDDNRTSVATELLMAAITDACEYLGIDWKLFTREELEAQGWKFDEKTGRMTKG